jgi:hypothetical protein
MDFGRLENVGHSLPIWLGFQSMPRKLVWLEDSTLAAWGCSACSWILVGSGPTANGKLPTEVQKSFDGHDCAKFARMIGSKAKRRDLPTA